MWGASDWIQKRIGHTHVGTQGSLRLDSKAGLGTRKKLGTKLVRGTK